MISFGTRVIFSNDVKKYLKEFDKNEISEFKKSISKLKSNSCNDELGIGYKMVKLTSVADKNNESFINKNSDVLHRFPIIYKNEKGKQIKPLQYYSETLVTGKFAERAYNLIKLMLNS